MTADDLQSIATTLVAHGKGILAADETVPTLTRRFDTLGIQSTEQSRRSHREMLFTAPGGAEFISGVILQDETIRPKSSAGTPLAEVLRHEGILPGIKVDTPAKPPRQAPMIRRTAAAGATTSVVNAKILESKEIVIASAAKQSRPRRVQPVEIASSLRSSQ